jgi:molybdopterin synthase catalytic subunit
MVHLTWSPILPAEVIELVADSAFGAVALFLGTVRETNEGRSVTGIEYSAYEAMAQAELERITSEARELHDGVRVAVVHRLGELGLGEISVAVVAAHAHRTPALEGMRYVIEALKKRVPIWKREHYIDGTREWVDPTRSSEEAVP